VTTTLGSTTTTTTVAPTSKVDWPTYGFDLQRTAHNPSETVLGTANVAKLVPVWTADVGAVVVASPVLAADVVVSGALVDLLYVGTEHGDLYALDAADGHIVWHRNLGSQTTACDDTPGGVFGITDTPVVDRASASLFVAGGDGTLAALDLATGTPRAGWPLTITADPAREHVWAAVTLTGGALYVETASYCDAAPYYGRVVKVDATAPAIVGTWYVTAAPGSGPGGGGIWGWGGASVDPGSGDLYVATGNALTMPESYGFAEQVVRLSNALVPEAANYPGLTGEDVDFGSTPVPVDGAGCPGQVVVENKSGVVFVYDRGAIASGPTQQLKIADYVDGGELIGVPAYDASTGTLFVSNPTDVDSGPYQHGLLAFTLGVDCTLRLAWQQTQGVNGAVISSPSIANGVVYYGDGPGNEVLAVSAASGTVLWRSGDTIHGGIYAPPIVANGRLYIAAWDDAVHAYALPAGSP
jgi:outer membrane protein assembly factor BamB